MLGGQLIYIYIHIYISLDDWLPVGINKVASYLSKYDGGTDLDLLREMPVLTFEQQNYLESAAQDDWQRPTVPLDDGSSLLPKIFTQPVNKLTVAQTPKYSLRSVLSGDGVPELDAQAWQRAFSQARWVEMFQAVEWIGRLDVYLCFVVFFDPL